MDIAFLIDVYMISLSPTQADMDLLNSWAPFDKAVCCRVAIDVL